MTSERRHDQRVRGPFEGTWSGTSGHRTVRVVDFSVSGCFIEDIATPAVGDLVALTLRVPGCDPIDAAGRVAYVDPPQGFAVKFAENDHLASALHAALRLLALQRP